LLCSGIGQRPQLQAIDFKRFFAAFPCKSPALTGDARNLLIPHADSGGADAALRQGHARR
jgi:hypothetical protein